MGKNAKPVPSGVIVLLNFKKMICFIIGRNGINLMVGLGSRRKQVIRMGQ